MGDSWHQRVKEVLKEIGESRGYDVYLEKEMLFSGRITLTKGEPSEVHTLTYRPDVIWMKDNRHCVVFVIEYLQKNRASIEKRKYAIGNLMLALMEKSCNNFVFVTNNEDLYNDVAKFIKLSEDSIKNSDKIWWHLTTSSTKKAQLRKELKDV